jgi:hypothetical protein
MAAGRGHVLTITAEAALFRLHPVRNGVLIAVCLTVIVGTVVSSRRAMTP